MRVTAFSNYMRGLATSIPRQAAVVKLQKRITCGGSCLCMDHLSMPEVDTNYLNTWLNLLEETSRESRRCAVYTYC